MKISEQEFKQRTVNVRGTVYKIESLRKTLEHEKSEVLLCDHVEETDTGWSCYDDNIGLVTQLMGLLEQASGVCHQLEKTLKAENEEYLKVYH
jgi:hypothetical protein